MAKCILLYSSHDGQTKKIMTHLAQQLSDYECELVDLATRPVVALENYAKVVVGAAIRYGHYDPCLYAFIKQHLAALTASDNSFFCVNLTARKLEKATPETNAYMRKFLARSPWQPKRLAVFAGALRYSTYNIAQTLIIQLIMTITGGSTDKSQDLEFTDWNKVTEFAQAIAK